MSLTLTHTRVLLLLILLMGSMHAWSQQPPRFYQLGTQDGLSHSWAKAISKDSKGYLWVGTINGLNRYDGKNFKVFKNDPTNSQSISDNFIQSIKEDSKGNLWIGTYSGGLNRFDRKTEAFEHFKNQPKNPKSLSDDRIHALFEDSKGRLWVGTERGLDQYNYENENFSHFYLNSDKNFIQGPVMAIGEDYTGQLWVGTDHGLYKIDFAQNNLTAYENLEKGLSSNVISSIYEDESGQLWIGTIGGGLNLFDRVTGNFTSIQTDAGDARLSHNSVLCITGDHAGNLIIGTEGGGVNIMNISNQQITVLSPNSDDPFSLGSNSIHSVYYDKTTQITWIGTYHNGVNYYSTLSKPFVHYKAGENGLNNSNVLSIREADGKIYVGTDGGGVNIIDLKKGTIQVLNSQRTNDLYIQSDAVLALLIDRAENLWIGGFNGGLDCLTQGGKMRHYLYDSDNSSSLSGRDVSALYQDKKGRIWIGTMKGGLNLFNPTDGSFKRYQHKDGDPHSLRDNFISLITENSEGELLIQTGKSLDVFDPSIEIFSDFGKNYQETIGFPISTLVDSRQNVWVGTREALFYFSKADNYVIRFTEKEGLPSSGITSLLEDDHDNLWMGTMNGLVKWKDAIASQEVLHLQVYTLEDGLQGNDFKDQACFKGADGTMYFGGQNGLNAFHPNEIRENPLPPEVVFTGFKLFNREVVFGKDQPLTTPISEATEINLTYQHNVFSIEFSALNFLLPEKNQYAYIMNGFEKEWNYVDHQSSATYTNLNPGTYTFTVKATNNDGVWNEKGASLLIHISPPWWATTWFKFIALSFFILGVVAVFRIRLYQLKARQKVLKRQVELATLEIQKVNSLLEERNDEIQIQNNSLLDKNDQLTHQNEALETQSMRIQKLLSEIQELNEMKLLFFTSISHELRTPLTLILGPLETLIAQSKATSDEHLELNVIHRNAVKLLQLINQLLDFRKIESGNIQLKATKKDLVSFTREIFDSFKLLAQKKAINYTFHANPEVCEVWFDPEKMEKIITNLLSNAFKYTGELGVISVKLKLFKSSVISQSHVDLIIQDSGKGIPEHQIDHIFDLYYQAQNAYNLEQAGTGIGLALIKQFVELHHGEIRVMSTEGIGTTLTIQFPMGNKHLEPSEMTEERGEKYLSQYTTLELESSFAEITEIIEEPLWTPINKDAPLLLIVEDNPDIRRYIRDSFRLVFKISEAGNGQEGLDASLKFLPDLIISDVMMPHMDGFTMCTKLKNDERTSHIPVILLTAYSGEEKQKEGFHSGADDYVTKPFNINNLQQKIKNIIQTRKNLIDRFSQSTSLDPTKMATNPSEEKFLTNAIEVIELNLTNANFDVEAFSDQFNMSRRNLLRKIKSVSGLSVSEFIKNIRLKRSVLLLQEGQMNISEIAYASGFSDPKYFSKCFKEQFGKSPSDYQSEIKR